MKVLIIEDNIAIQEIIKDILVEEGHLVRVAGSISEGIEKMEFFKPDVVFLEYRLDEGMVLLRDHDVKVVLIKTNYDPNPDKNSNLIECINKPFTSDDIRNAIDKVAGRMMIIDQAAPKKKTFERATEYDVPGLLERIFKKKEKPPVADNPIRFGDSYVIFEERPDYIYRLIWVLISRDNQIMVVTSDKKKVIDERFERKIDSIVSMSYTSKPNLMYIRDLGKLLYDMDLFIDSKARPVICIDNINTMIEANGFDTTVRFLHQLLKKNVAKKKTVIVSVSDNGLSDKDRAILLHEMQEYDRFKRYLDEN